MAHRFKEGMLYRMPAHFGPTAGPRQGPDGQTFDWTDSPRRTTVSLGFRTEPAALEALLPPGLALVGEPLVTIEITYLTELEWLAGRGYNMLGVRFPAEFRGRRDHVVGSFLSILWENLSDPILSGRDELGFSKLYCEIPDPRVLRGRRSHNALWLGHEFFTLDAWDLAEVPAAAVAAAAVGVRNDGLLHFKYVPRTGTPGQADIAAVTFTPAAGSRSVVDRAWRGQGTHAFRRSTWEQLPTMFHIVNALEGLPVVERGAAWVVQAHGGKDLGDQRTLE